MHQWSCADQLWAIDWHIKLPAHKDLYFFAAEPGGRNLKRQDRCRASDEGLSLQLQARPLQLWSFASDSPCSLFHSGLIFSLISINFSLLLPLSIAPCIVLNPLLQVLQIWDSGCSSISLSPWLLYRGNQWTVGLFKSFYSFIHIHPFIHSGDIPGWCQPDNSCPLRCAPF